MTDAKVHGDLQCTLLERVLRLEGAVYELQKLKSPPAEYALWQKEIAEAFERGRVAGLREAHELFSVHSSAGYAVERLLEKAIDRLESKK